MTIGQRIKERRKQLGMSAEDVALKLGKHPATVYRYENGDIENMPTNVLYPIAEALQTTPAQLMGWDIPENVLSVNDIYPKNTTKELINIPVLGRVAAGVPITAQEDIIGWEEVPASWVKNDDIFALQIKGDSMEPRIVEGDIVICRAQPDVNHGETAIVMVNGDEATCKKVAKSADGIMLISNNPKYLPMQYTNKQIEELPVRILGKVIELRARLC